MWISYLSSALINNHSPRIPGNISNSNDKDKDISHHEDWGRVYYCHLWPLISGSGVWSVLFPQLVYLCNAELTYLMSTSQMSPLMPSHFDQSEALVTCHQPMRGQQSLGPWLVITRHSCRYCSHPLTAQDETTEWHCVQIETRETDLLWVCISHLWESVRKVIML